MSRSGFLADVPVPVHRNFLTFVAVELVCNQCSMSTLQVPSKKRSMGNSKYRV